MRRLQITFFAVFWVVASAAAGGTKAPSSKSWSGAVRIERVLPRGWYLPVLNAQTFYRGKLFETDDQLADIHGAWHPLVIMVVPGDGTGWRKGDRLTVSTGGTAECEGADDCVVDNLTRHQRAWGGYTRLDDLRFSSTDPGRIAPLPPPPPPSRALSVPAPVLAPVVPAAPAQPVTPLAVSQGVVTPPPGDTGIITVIDPDASCGDLLSREAHVNFAASMFSGYTGTDTKARELREEACASDTDVYTSIALTGSGSYAVTARDAIQAAHSWRSGDNVQVYSIPNKGYCAEETDFVLDDLTRHSWLCASF